MSKQTTILLLATVLAGAFALAAGACSSAPSGDGTPHPPTLTARAEEPPTTLPATASPPALDPGGGQRIEVEAPIDGLDLMVLESYPPRYVLRITVGLPDGCARPGRNEVSREGPTIRVTVFNTRPAGNVACTQVYGTYELRIDLGSDFQTGRQYTVSVNNRTLSFSAQ